MQLDDRIKVMIDQDTLEKRIAELGREISRTYEGKELILLCVLKGAAMFMMQLAKSIEVPLAMEFMVLSSYGNSLISSGEVEIKKDMEVSCKGRHVLIVEDIVDTGRTLAFLSSLLIGRGAESVKVCAMLDKPSRRVVPVQVDFRGFEIADEFVLGYGLDYEQKYRNLPYVAYLSQEDEA